MASLNSSVEQQIAGSRQFHYWQELFRNSGQFPLAILLIEIFLEGRQYFLRPDFYILIVAALIQTWWLTRDVQLIGWRRLIGNLIAPFIYTGFEFAIEGWSFFQGLHHSGYWVFAFMIGMLQAIRSSRMKVGNSILLIFENLVRSQILFVAYAIYEIYINSQPLEALFSFFNDPSHILILFMTVVFGLLTGLADWNAQSLFFSVQKTAQQLKIYSEWLLGRDLLGRALNDPQAMSLKRRERTILFMDIRNFTRWSETCSPEDVANLIHQYYAVIEKVLENYAVIKFKLTADEVMAIFIDPSEAVFAARELLRNSAELLASHGLGAGIGINTGAVVEGLFGSQNVRFYDVLGDTVNTAQRIEVFARSGEIWVSESTYKHLKQIAVNAEQEIQVKGKEEPLRVYCIMLS